MYYVEVYNRHYDTYDCYIATPDKTKAQNVADHLSDRGWFVRISFEK